MKDKYDQNQQELEQKKQDLEADLAAAGIKAQEYT